MKNSWEWDESDLLALIKNGIKESVELDYKACAAIGSSEGKKNELSKDISALANSAGGTLVYGMLENGHVPTALDVGINPAEFSKEWIEQVINSRIQRRIDGVRVNQVELTTTATGKVAYVIHVPQSTRAPHQASDKRFYKRFNFESAPMEEYELRDISMRHEGPDLEFHWQFAPDPAPARVDPEKLAFTVALKPCMVNLAVAPAEYIVLDVLIDPRIDLPNGFGDFRSAGVEYVSDFGEALMYRHFHFIYSIPGKLPVFQGITVALSDIPLKMVLPGAGQYKIRTTVFSPRMNSRVSICTVVADGASISMN